jgi:hypothetical protein
MAHGAVRGKAVGTWMAGEERGNLFKGGTKRL